MEYLTTGLSIGIVFALQQSRHFSIGAQTVATGTLVMAGAAQVLPELVLDGVMVWFESKAGLGRHIAQHWRLQRNPGLLVSKCMLTGILACYIGIVFLRWD